ncbi:hypothetical protein KAS79_00405 [Candidatus Parcubacteria bacterium]|nr:hypothetical protein [Candidatus Parcubacteria bacterium]
MKKPTTEIEGNKKPTTTTEAMAETMIVIAGTPVPASQAKQYRAIF